MREIPVILHRKLKIVNMKFKSIIVAAVALLGFAACSEKGKENGTVTDLFGEYGGYTLASCNFFKNSCTAGEKVEVTENADGTVRIAFTSASLGEFTVAQAQKSFGDGACLLTGEGKARMGMGEQVSTYDCSFKAKIRSKDEAWMQFSVPAVMGGLTVDFSTGEAPAHLLLPGTYKGYTDADSKYFQNKYTDGETLTVKANGDGSVGVSLKSATWGTFEVASATTGRKGDRYTFEGKGRVEMGMGETTSSYDFTVVGEVSPAKNDYSVVFRVPAVMGGLTVTLLPGKAPDGGK